MDPTVFPLASAPCLCACGRVMVGVSAGKRPGDGYAEELRDLLRGVP